MADTIRIEAMQGANLARIVNVPPPSGSRVEAGQLLFEVENHKVVQEIESLSSGVLVHDLVAGDCVYLDVPIAFVTDENDNLDSLLVQAKSAKAAADADWALVVGSCPIGPTNASSPEASKRVTIAKATEIAVLGNGPGNSLQATLGAAIGPIWRGQATANFFQDKITDLVVYEASRLLATKKFSKLNTYFENGHIIQHEHISPGISFDEGGRLTLYAIRDADTLSLLETQDSLIDGLMRYVGKKLVLKDVSASTFTISDVTTTDLNLSVPLLPRGQCIILVVIRDAAQGYMLSISYDHRVTEGLVVAGFAQELIKRLRSYSVPPSVEGDEHWAAPPAICAYCESTLQSEVAEFKRRGLLKIVDDRGEEVYCCATCWENW